MRWVRKILDFIGLRDWPMARKIVVSVIGTTIVLIGVALLFLPGPGSVVIPAGLIVWRANLPGPVGCCAAAKKW